jgi:hypothetical protein
MNAVSSEFKRSAILCAWLTIPIYLFGLYLFDVHGSHMFEFTSFIGLIIIYPAGFIHDSGLQYHLGLGSLPLIFIIQWAWYLIPVHLCRILVRSLRSSIYRAL